MKFSSLIAPVAGVAIVYADYRDVTSFTPFIRTLIYSTIAIVSVAVYYFQSVDEWRGGGVSGMYNTPEHAESMKAKGSTVTNAVEGYVAHFGEKSRTGDAEHEALVSKRQSNYMEMVNHFYDLVTDFYEYGWCDSFHFAPRFPAEGHIESIRRAEYFLSSRLQLKSGMKCVDVGCGVGGPMRNIARFSQAKIVGVNNNDYQIKVGTRYNENQGLSHLCSFQKSDFMRMPFNDNTFDAAYAIEATCHAPNKEGVFGEIYRIMKPGALFNCYEWVMLTGKYDKNNQHHRAIKEGIEVGNGLPSLVYDEEVIAALKKVGFEVVEYYDANRGLHQNNEIAWYQPLAGGYGSLEGFRKTPIGRSLTTAFVTILESVGIAPKGSTKVSKLLSDTADDLVKAGRLEIFTPSFYFLVRKPIKA